MRRARNTVVNTPVYCISVKYEIRKLYAHTGAFCDPPSRLTMDYFDYRVQSETKSSDEAQIFACVGVISVCRGATLTYTS